MVDLDYLKMTSWQKFCFRFRRFFTQFPQRASAFFRGIPGFFGRLGKKFAGLFTEVWETFRDGDWKTRLSFVFMGFGQIARGQVLKGLLYFLFEAAFVLYMVFFGWSYLARLGSLGDVAVVSTVDPETGLTFNKYIDNSMLILLYGLLTVFFVIAFLYVWRFNVVQNGRIQQRRELGFPLESARDDLRALADKQYYKTLLAMPLLGILIFTVIPIAFMILIAFTNYDASHQPPGKLFDWVGLQNFGQLFGGSGVSGEASFGYTFGAVLIWTLIWAVFATFSNYFLGMIVALMINKKGIKGKKIFRTILVLTIAVPQFISLLLVSKMFAEDGIVNGLLLNWGIIAEKIKWLTTGTLARVMVVLINIWVGIPYLMLITTGILMNIPEDLYESARIDGASPFKMYTKITLPYMLFVTTPYLITSFIANINNFNVIYLLTGGAPKTMSYATPAGYTDLLVTWLYKLTMQQESDYKMASVIGIMVFLVVAVFSLIVYNRSRSVKDEEEFQ